MIGLGDNTAYPRPSSVTITEVAVILPGRPSDDQLEFGIPVIRDVSFDRLRLEFGLCGNSSLGTGTKEPNASNTDTTPGTLESSSDFLKTQSRSTHYPSALRQEKSDDPVQDKAHSIDVTSDGSVQCITSGVDTATAENGPMASDLMNVSTRPAGCPGLHECDAGLSESSKPAHTPTAARQEQRDEKMQDMWSSATDPARGGPSQTRLVTPQLETDIPVNVTGSDGCRREDAEIIMTQEAKKNDLALAPGRMPSSHTNLKPWNRNSVWYKNSRKERLGKR